MPTVPINPAQASLTGTWQGPVDAGGTTQLLQFVLIEDAGTLDVIELIQDPVTPATFHTIENLTGTHSGTTVTLQAALSGDTINATFDGGTLAGIDPASEPLMFRDGGSVHMLNVAFSMQRLSTDTPALDGGFQ